jgi:hypothetical protein
MFCPKCGVRNLEDAKFCRACGVDIRFVPQALNGQLHAGADAALEIAEGTERGRKGRKQKHARKKLPTLEEGLENIFFGIGLLVVFALGFFYFRGSFWWVWLILPALACVGDGLGQVIRSRREPSALSSSAVFEPQSIAQPPRRNELPAADTGEIVPPPSITESTTRNLVVPAERASRDA